jgi:hypothetical protein
LGYCKIKISNVLFPERAENLELRAYKDDLANNCQSEWLTSVMYYERNRQGGIESRDMKR